MCEFPFTNPVAKSANFAFDGFAKLCSFPPKIMGVMIGMDRACVAGTGHGETCRFPGQIDDVTIVLEALANAQRLRVMGILFANEASSGYLAETLGASASAISQHLRRLREAGLVTTRRDGQMIYYSADTTRAEAAYIALDEIVAGLVPHSRDVAR